MKKILSLLLALVMCGAVLVSCGDTEEPDTTTEAPKVTTEAPKTTTTDAPPATDEPVTPPTTEAPSDLPSTDTTGVPCINDIEGIEARVYAFEIPSEFGGNVGLIYYMNDAANNTHTTLIDAVNSNSAYALVSLNGTLYEIPNYANSGNFFRMDIEGAGATLIAGMTYEVIVYFYDMDNKMIYHTAPETIASTLTTANANVGDRAGQNIELPTGLTDASVESASVTAEGLSAWGDGAATNLFDGDTAGTKLGGGTSGSVTVNFALESPATVSYYTLYTGGDTSKSPERNPLGWTLYGKVDGEWVVLDTISSTETLVTGLEATDSTPYSYKIASPVECGEYKIVFITGGAVQLNEMVLHVG